MWLAVTPDELPPSPKLQAYEVIEPSESDEPDALKLTANGACPAVDDAVKLAEGGLLATGVADTWIVRVVASVAPSSSVTVNRAV